MNTPFFIILLGLIIRLLYAAFSHDFWFDEAYDYSIAQNNPGVILQALSYDNWPPLYTILMHYWQTIGHSVLFLRLPSVLFGTATLIVIYKIAKMLFAKKVAQIALALSAVSPPLVYFSAENRDYSLFALFAALTTLAYLNFAKKQGLKNGLAYVTFATLALYTHYFAVLIIVTLPLAGFLTGFARPKLKNLLTCQLAMIILFSPWFIYSFAKEKPVCLCLGAFTGLLANFAFTSLGGAGIVTLKGFLEGQTPIAIRLYLITIVIASNLIIFYVIKFVKKPPVAWLVSVFIIPQILVFLISFQKPLFSPRSFIFLVPIFLLLTSFAISKISKNTNLKHIFSIYFLASIITLLLTSQKLFFNQEPLEKTSRVLNKLSNVDTQIIHANLYTYLPSTYYYPHLKQYVARQPLPTSPVNVLNTKPYQGTKVPPAKSILVFAKNRVDYPTLKIIDKELTALYRSKQTLTLDNITIIIYDPKI